MIDLHMHTTFSDGSDDLVSLISRVKEAGISTFSITDHDTAEAGRKILRSPELQKMIAENGQKFVVGAEFTCLFEGQKMHILAYDFDPFAPEVFKLEKQMSDLLKQKDEHRLKAIDDAGFVLSNESKKFLSSRLNIRKIDLANCLVNDGYFKNIDDAIQSFLEHIKYPIIYRLDGKEVLETLSKLGAKMVWAHSLHGKGEKPISHEKVDEFVSKMKQYGLAGLECYYSLYGKDEIEGLLKIAHKHGLFVTAGSDYHGKNKNTPLGMTSSDGTFVDENEIKIFSVFKNFVG